MAAVGTTKLDVHLANDLGRFVDGAEADEVCARGFPQDFGHIVLCTILLHLTGVHQQAQAGPEGDGLVDRHRGQGVADRDDALCDSGTILARSNAVQSRVDVPFRRMCGASEHQDGQRKSIAIEHVMFPFVEMTAVNYDTLGF